MEAIPKLWAFSISMNLEDCFHTLIDTQKITLQLSRTSANSLRTSLLRKLKDYKKQTEALGWLSDEIAKSTISLEFDPPANDAETGTARIYLRPKKRAPMNYVLLEEPEPEQSEPPNDDTNPTS